MKDKKFLKEVAIILLFGVLINGFCFFICSITGHCAVDPTLYFPMSQGDGEITQDVMSLVTQYDSQLHWSEYPDDTYYKLVFAHQQYNSQGVGGTVFICCLYSLSEPKAELNSDNHTFYVQNLATTVNNSAVIYELTRYGNGTTTVNNRNGWIQNGRINQALQSSQYHPNTSSDRYSYYSNFTMLFYDSAVCLYGPSMDIGEFSDLPNIDQILNNIQNTWEPPSTVTGHALPSSPTENSNNNDFQNRLQMFQYLGDIITQNFGNLGYNLSNWFNGLQQKLTNGFNSVSQNIWNGFKTLMDNIQDFFGPKLDYIIEKFNYITEDPDPEEIQTFFESTSVYTDISSIQTSATSFVTSFTGVNEPDDYVFTLHIENISLLGQTEPFYLHLNILNPVKSYIRGILWVVVSYGIFISIIDSLPNYINGGGGEDD